MGKLSSLDKNMRKKDLKATKKTLDKLQIHKVDVDSLNCFKQKTNENIDDRFKLLKSELHSLFQTSKAEANESISSNYAESNQTKSCDKFEKQQNSNNSVSPNPSKFSEWLSDTIEKMEMESLNSSINKNEECDESLPSTPKLVKSKYHMTLLPNYKVQRLLYKSFQLQNLGIYVPSSSDESEAEQFKSSKVRKQQKRRSRKPSRRSFSSSFPKKRKTAPLNNDVEIVNLKGIKKGSNKNIDYDLDVESYDWNEPFLIKNSTDSSDLEIIEDDQSIINLNEKKQNAKVDLKESDITTKTDEQDSSKTLISADARKIWECPICFEPSQGQSIVATQCGHIFCKACLEEHKSVHGKFCPTCRLDLSDKPPITLFNI